MDLLSRLYQCYDLKKWDAIIDSMSLEKRLAQMIHIPAWSNRGEKHLEELKELVSRYQLGGVIFFQGNAELQHRWTEEIQSLSDPALLISMDAEWGLGMRLDASPVLPYHMTLGASPDPGHAYEVGLEIGRQLAEIGVHINFAPLVDLNTEAKNPVIGFRSFGSDPKLVGQRALAYARGLHDSGILPVIKHFPGHGDTQSDSHLTLPVLAHDTERLEKVELEPFKFMIEEEVPAMMSAHLHVPTWDPRPGRAVTHSSPIIQEILKNKLGFRGILFTDALDMKGVAESISPSEINALAMEAGHDALLFCVDVPASLDAMVRKVEAGAVSEEEINHRCRKILSLKEVLGISNTKNPGLNLEKAFRRAHHINLKVAASALTWRIKPKESLQQKSLEYHLLDMKKDDADELAHHRLTHRGGENYQSGTRWKQLLIHEGFKLNALQKESLSLTGAPEVHLMVHGISVKARDGFGLDLQALSLLEKLLEKKTCHLLWMGSPHALAEVAGWEKAASILIAYQEGPEYEEAAAGVILQGNPVQGHLPVKMEDQ